MDFAADWHVSWFCTRQKTVNVRTNNPPPTHTYIYITIHAQHTKYCWIKLIIYSEKENTLKIILNNWYNKLDSGSAYENTWWDSLLVWAVKLRSEKQNTDSGSFSLAKHELPGCTSFPGQAEK